MAGGEPVGDPDATGPIEIRRPWALSPSRAADFKTCPLLYRFRAVDHLPEPPSAPAARGTLVHAVLEQLYALPAAERTVATATASLPGAWDRMCSDRADLPDLVAPEDLPGWLESARSLLQRYFSLEDPASITPAARELLVEIVTPAGMLLRGYVDRLDLVADGGLRVVDYKTGRSPGEQFEQAALFQMKFYALMIWRSQGVHPRQLTLLYLGDTESLRYTPSEFELLAFERTLGALWTAVSQARQTGDFPPRPSRVCGWCAYQSLCPTFGGTPPAYPFPDADRPVVDPATAPVGGPPAPLPAGPPTVPIPAG